MINWINFNGYFYKNDTPILDAENRSFKYGDGIFETMKMKEGILILEEEHFARLWKGIEILQLTKSLKLTTDILRKEILKLANKNNNTKNTRVRINVFRGNDYNNYDTNYLIQTWDLNSKIEELNSEGICLGIYYDVKKSCDILSNLKTNSYLPFVMAQLYAKNNNWNDTIILNCTQQVCETTIANIFIIKESIIYTPSLSQGCVEGITRNYYIQQFKLLNIICVQKEICIDELLQADEVFLTNSIFNIRWVKQINDKTYKNSFIKNWYNKIQHL